MSPTILAKSAARRKARQGLRDRAVRHTADARDAQIERVRYAEARHVMKAATAEAAGAVLLSAYLRRSREQLPAVRHRNHLPTLRALDRMHVEHRDLVFLMFKLPYLDRFDLHDPELVQVARKLLAAGMKRFMRGGAPFTIALQRGGETNGTHAHIVIPLAYIRQPHRDKLMAAPRGKKGGRWLTTDVHGVIIHNTPVDFERVARYVSRHMDSRLYLSDDDARRVQAFEEILERKESGIVLPRSAWAKK